MSQLIEGVKIELTTAELRSTLEQRREHHQKKAGFYREQVAALQAQGVNQQQVTNDPVSSLKASLQMHADKQAFFAFLAEHLVADAQYRLSDHDLARLEVLAAYY